MLRDTVVDLRRHQLLLRVILLIAVAAVAALILVFVRT
jgi:hypothetical protein